MSLRWPLERVLFALAGSMVTCPTLLLLRDAGVQPGCDR